MLVCGMAQGSERRVQSFKINSGQLFWPIASKLCPLILDNPLMFLCLKEPTNSINT